jgi:hypothetical protein
MAAANLKYFALTKQWFQFSIWIKLNSECGVFVWTKNSVEIDMKSDCGRVASDCKIIACIKHL